VVYYGSDATRFPLVTRNERAVARRAFGVPPSRRLVGFIGALGNRRKAFDTMFDAWFQLCMNPEWDADLLVVGAGSERAHWMRRATEVGLGARIRFAGFRPDMPEVIAALDVLVHPARYEAYGLAVHEALCRGVPALVTRSAGVAERYPSELADLLIADPDDSGELVDRLRRWRRHADDLQVHAASLSRTLHERTWNVMAADIARLAENA
jgi:glycosyltransferase involved in cell wall biosynthesis